jgi:hypothetical protein
LSNKNLIIPEYKIDLLNKNKKVIKKVYNIEDIEKSTNKPNDQRMKFSKNKYNKNYNKKGKFREKFNYKSNVEKKYIDNNKKSVSY